MIINLDILILENSIVNFFLLHITSQTIRVKFKIKKAIISSVLGGIYVITIVFQELRILTLLPFKIIIVLIMIYILFANKNIILLLKASIIYMLYSMLLAGLCFFIEYNKNPFTSIGTFKYNFSYKKLMLAIMVIYLIINRLVIYIRDRKEVCSLIFKVDIKNNNSIKTITAFLDTGNELREPATNLPVMIMEKVYYDEFDITENKKLYIPYRVVSGQSSNLVGFKPEYIKIYNGNEVKMREVIIAFCDNKISDLNEYQALLSRGII